MSIELTAISLIFGVWETPFLISPKLEIRSTADLDFIRVLLRFKGLQREGVKCGGRACQRPDNHVSEVLLISLLITRSGQRCHSNHVAENHEFVYMTTRMGVGELNCATTVSTISGSDSLYCGRGLILDQFPSCFFHNSVKLYIPAQLVLM